MCQYPLVVLGQTEGHLGFDARISPSRIHLVFFPVQKGLGLQPSHADDRVVDISGVPEIGVREHGVAPEIAAYPAQGVGVDADGLAINETGQCLMKRY